MTMLPTHRIATHPGELLKRLFLDEMGITQVAFAKHCRISLQRLNEIIRGKRSVTAQTAWIFGQALGTTPQFWMNAQVAHDLTKNRPTTKLPQIKAKAA
jgi:addiction module HigA family antidote